MNSQYKLSEESSHIKAAWNYPNHKAENQNHPPVRPCPPPTKWHWTGSILWPENWRHRRMAPCAFPEHPSLKSLQSESGVPQCRVLLISKGEPPFWCHRSLKKRLHVIPGQWNTHVVPQRKQDKIQLPVCKQGRLLSRATQGSQHPCPSAAHCAWSDSWKSSSSLCLSPKALESSWLLFLYNIPQPTCQ